MSDWLTYSPITGHGNSTVTLTAQTLSELEDRVATMVGYNVSYAISASTEITQKAEPPTAITFDSLSVVWVSDIPASGGTATKDNCSYKVYANYSDGSQVDVTNLSEVTGSLNVPATTAETRQSAGQLTLIASFDGESASTSVDVYQEGKALSYIDFKVLEKGDIPASGCEVDYRFFEFELTLHYNNTDIEYLPQDAFSFSGSKYFSATTATTRECVGQVTITGTYGGFTKTKNIYVYQRPVYSKDYNSITFIANAYIDTGIIPDSNTKIEILNYSAYNTKYIRDGRDNDYSVGSPPFQLICGTSNVPPDFLPKNVSYGIQRYRVNENHYMLRFSIGNTTGDTIAGFHNIVDNMSISLDKNLFTFLPGFTIDVGGAEDGENLNSTLYIGAGHYEDSCYDVSSNMTVGEIKIYQSGVLVSDLIPNNSHGVTCFYDNVNNRYVNNIGYGVIGYNI